VDSVAAPARPAEGIASLRIGSCEGHDFDLECSPESGRPRPLCSRGWRAGHHSNIPLSGRVSD
jgi:hypothetical protein